MFVCSQGSRQRLSTSDARHVTSSALSAVCLDLVVSFGFLGLDLVVDSLDWTWSYGGIQDWFGRWFGGFGLGFGDQDLTGSRWCPPAHPRVVVVSFVLPVARSFACFAFVVSSLDVVSVSSRVGLMCWVLTVLFLV